MNRVTGFYGLGGEGKTTIGQQLATACALSDAKWLGLPVRHCRSLLWFCEDDMEEMWRRQDDINRHYSCTFQDLSLMRWLPRLGEDNVFMTFEQGAAHLTKVFASLLEYAQDFKPELIEMDTLADIFGGEESQRSQVRAFVQTALGKLARAVNAAVMALGHPSVTGSTTGTGSSGSTGWQGTFRSHLYLATPRSERGEETDHDARVLTRVKTNFARRGDTLELTWRNGGYIPVHEPMTGTVGTIDKRNCNDVFMRLLHRLVGDGRHVTDKSRASNYAPRIFSTQPDRERFKEADFTMAMQRLFAAKQIKMGSYKDSRRRAMDCILPVEATP
jgi:RecA-family ATPase